MIKKLSTSKKETPADKSTEIKTTLTFEEMPKNRLRGFNVSWLDGTDNDGKEFGLNCGAGCGSSGIWFSYKGKQYTASIVEVVKQLCNSIK